MTRLYLGSPGQHATPCYDGAQLSNPEWSEKDGSFTVTLDQKDSAILLFAVWDEDTVSDDFLGQAFLNFLNLLPQAARCCR